MIQRRLLPAVLLCTLFALLAPAQQPASQEAPKPLTHYMGREIAQTMHWTGARWLTREEREKEEDTKTLIRALHVKAGQTVCDLGCGNGFYTLQLAGLVGDSGKVIAQDIQPEMLRMLRGRAEKDGIKNIQYVLGLEYDPKLPENAMDMILLVDVYHEMSNPPEMLAGMRKALKPDGRLVLAEFRLEDDTVPIKLLHRMSKAQVRKELGANGFKCVEEFDELPWQHLMFFQKDDAGK
jgi:ubiquinone/menaquinone biosynthesis C-methylase UbiE